ncbi:MAG: hypothetical protein ACFFC3_05845 [Candidatus Odinarchaeota archaeon]
MTKNEDPGACIVVIGIVMAVGDWIVFNTGFLIFVGVFIVIIGIATSSSFKKKVSSPVSHPQTNYTQNNTQLIEKVPQDITPVQNFRKKHTFCSYCGLKTSSDICPACGREID